MEITTSPHLGIVNDYDGALKAILDRYFPCFLQLINEIEQWEDKKICVM